MFSFKKNKTYKYLFTAVLPLLLFFFTSNSFAQKNVTEDNSSNLSGTVKIMGLAPAVGIDYQLSKKSKLRGLGAFTFTNSSTASNGYLFDLSYIRNFNTVGAVNSYWALNLSVQFIEPIIGPGFLVGASYELNEKFSVFGEAGLNIFFVGGGNTTTVNMFNSGVGINVNF